MLPVLAWLNHDAFQSLLGGCLQGDGGAIGSSGCIVCSRIMRLLPHHVRARWMAGSRIWNLELYFLFSGVFLQFDTATPRRRSTRTKRDKKAEMLCFGVAWQFCIGIETKD